MSSYREIMLTGGPHSGKSTTRAALAKYFTPLGIDVWVPGPAYNSVLASGLPSNEQSWHLALDLHLAFREGYRRAAERCSDPVLIIYEGGEGDLKSLGPEAEWSAALAEREISEAQALFSYDLVLHLVSDDRPRDDLVLSSWLGHPNLKMLSGAVPEKITKAIKSLQELIGLEEPIEYERKFLVHNQIDPELHLPAGTTAVEISQTYLRSEQDEQRVRAWRHGEAVLYFWTKKSGSGAERREQEEIIGYEQYLELLNNRDPERITIEKTRWCFRHDDRRCELDHFKQDDLWLLEVELDGPDDHFEPPNFLELSEVTDDPRFKNSELARKKSSRGRADAELV